MKLLLPDEDIELISVTPLEGITASVISQRKEKTPNSISRLEKTLIAIDGASRDALSQADIAKLHGVSHTTVSHLGRGYDRPNIQGRQETQDKPILDSIERKITEVKEDITNKLHSKLERSLDIFLPEKLEQKQLPSVIGSLAKAIDTMMPKNVNDGVVNNVQFVVMQPKMRTIDEFETVKVTE